MNFFDTLMEGIEVEETFVSHDEINDEILTEMEMDEMAQEIEVMEANKFLATSRLASLEVERACLEATLTDIDEYFLGESVIGSAKDKILELWEKFKEWVQTILAKVKVFFAKFAMSRKAMTALDMQFDKAQKVTDKYNNALKSLGITKGDVFSKADADGVKGVLTASAPLTAVNVEALKNGVTQMQDKADKLAEKVKDAITNDKASLSGLGKLHSDVVATIGTFIKGLESTIKSTLTAQKKHDRLGRGTDKNVDAEAVSEMRGIINAANRIYATAIKAFFHEVRVVKNIIAFVGKGADLSTQEKKDNAKLKGRVKF